MNLGLGVMIQMLGGNAESVTAFAKGIGQKIASVEINDNALVFAFENGYRMSLADEGQSCCESRYMRTDDDLSYFTGATLFGAEIKDAPNVSTGECDDHEVQFLQIKTDRGDFTMSNHNEHSGYYGGFSICASELKGTE